MTVVSDMNVIHAPESPAEDIALPFNDNEWVYGTGGRDSGSAWSTIDLEWGRTPGVAPFQVEISVNGTVVASRVPPEVDSGNHVSFERVYVYRLIRDGRNRLRLRSTLSSQDFLIRSISNVFHQDV